MIGVNLIEAELTAVRTEGALSPDELFLLFGILEPGMTLRPNGQSVAIDAQMDILLIKAGQIALQKEVISFVNDIGAEFSQRIGVIVMGEGITKEVSLQFLHLTEGIIHIARTDISAIHFIHNKNLHKDDIQN